MERRSLVVVVLFVIAGCSQMPSMPLGLGGWTTLIDGEKGLENFNRIGGANWMPKAAPSSPIAARAATW